MPECRVDRGKRRVPFLGLQARQAAGSTLNPGPILIPQMQAHQSFPRSGIIWLAAGLSFEKTHGIDAFAPGNQDAGFQQVRERLPRGNPQQRVDLPVRFVEVGAVERHISVRQPNGRMIGLKERQLVGMLLRCFDVSARQGELSESAERACIASVQLRGPRERIISVVECAELYLNPSELLPIFRVAVVRSDQRKQGGAGSKKVAGGCCCFILCEGGLRPIFPRTAARQWE